MLEWLVPGAHNYALLLVHFSMQFYIDQELVKETTVNLLSLVLLPAVTIFSRLAALLLEISVVEASCRVH